MAKNKKPTEEMEQVDVARYIATNYPSIEFHSDFGSGARLTMGQAKRQKKLNADRRGWPDMFIAEPVAKYNGLFIELKRSGEKLHKKNGDWTCEHYKEQAEQIAKLKAKGYMAEFTVGFDEAISLVDKYMRGEYGRDTRREN